MGATNQQNALALEAKKKLTADFFKKGITVAILSGMSYGMYSAFVNAAMGNGVWADWLGENTVLSTFITVYVLGAL